MYGTIMRGKVKAGKKDEYIKLMREEVPSADDYGQGFHSIEIGWEDKDPDRFVGIVHFKDRDSYVKNAERPETDSSYRKQLEYLESAPEWIDVNWGEYVGKQIGEGSRAGVA